MSSSTDHGSSALVTVLSLSSLALITVGCGRSPAVPRSPTMVRVDTSGTSQVVTCASEDDEDDDESEPRRPPPVQYVHISEWQPPPSAQRAAAEVTPRGSEAPTYTEFPKLTLHKPIGETTISGRYRFR
jgi:hypothetical protein